MDSYNLGSWLELLLRCCMAQTPGLYSQLSLSELPSVNILHNLGHCQIPYFSTPINLRMPIDPGCRHYYAAAEMSTQV